MRPIVLVVEPETVHASELTAILEEAFGVAHESGSKGVLQRLSARQHGDIDAVIMTVELEPYMMSNSSGEGLHLLELIVEQHGLPVVALLNREDARLRKACREAGAEGIAVKGELTGPWLFELLGVRTKSDS